MADKRRRQNNLQRESRTNVQPTIQANEVHATHLIGSGTFGKVYRGKCRQQDVAVKVLNKQRLEPKDLESFHREISIMAAIQHPNIVLYLGACFDPGNMMIVTEYLPKGDLDDLLKNPNIQLSLLTRMRMAKDVALGMTWLHSSRPQLVHRDLKTKNLLVDEHNRIKICDFGLSQVKLHGNKLKDVDGAKGTPLWMAPEVLTGKPFDERCDVYSYGIVLWCLLTRREPFEEYEEYEVFRNDICFKHIRPPIPERTPQSLATLIRACWHPDPDQRPSFDMIVGILNNIIVEVAILDDAGRQFWKTYFIDRVQYDEFVVPWEEMQNCILDYSQHFNQESSFLPQQPTIEEIRLASDFQLNEFSSRGIWQGQFAQEEWRRRYGSPPNFQATDDNPALSLLCFKEVVAIKENHSTDFFVEIEKFGMILSWFGPMVSEGKFKLLDRIRRVLSNDWFHGDISQQSAEDLLRVQHVGTFLVRFSSVPGSYTISSVEDTQIMHRRIGHLPGQGFRLGQHAYNTIEALVNEGAQHYGWAYPCNGSKYQRLFTERHSGYEQSSVYMSEDNMAE